MNIHFSETEAAEQAYFREQLTGHQLSFGARLAEVGPDVEILSLFIGERLDAAFLESHPRLRLIAARSYSVDHLDLAACHARQVAVANVPEHGEHTVAEHTLALLLAVARRLRQIMGKSKEPFSYARTRAFDLCGKTLGLIGLGRIGQRVAALARSFEMEVLACDPAPRADVAARLGCAYVPLEELLARSHVISLHAALTAETYHLINAASLAKCRRGVLIVNTARGRLIDTAALRDALESGQVGGAGLDVLEDERVLRAPAAQIIAGDIIEKLRGDASADEAHNADRLREVEELMLGDALLARANVVFTPHVAFNSLDNVESLAETTARNIAAFCAGAPINLAATAAK